MWESNEKGEKEESNTGVYMRLSASILVAVGSRSCRSLTIRGRRPTYRSSDPTIHPTTPRCAVVKSSKLIFTRGKLSCCSHSRDRHGSFCSLGNLQLDVSLRCWTTSWTTRNDVTSPSSPHFVVGDKDTGACATNEDSRSQENRTGGGKSHPSPECPKRKPCGAMLGPRACTRSHARRLLTTFASG